VVALIVGLAALAIAIGVVLSRSPLTVAGTNSIPDGSPIASVAGGTSACQTSGTIPQGTSAIRISVSQNSGPKVTLEALSGPFIVARGERPSGWGIDETVTVPVERVTRTIPNAKICVAFGRAVESVRINGALVRTASAGGAPATALRFRVEYLRPGDSSWWTLASGIARRMGFGHAPSGTWIVFLLLALTIAIVALASWLILRELATRRRRAAQAGKALGRIPSLLGRVPRAAWICALIACLNAVVWSLITPPFQVPDEPVHFAYVQQLAETRSLPTSENSEFSEEEEVALRELRQSEVRWHPEVQGVSTAAHQRRLERELAMSPGRTGSGGAGYAANEPPVYYALETIPYALGSSGSLLDRLELMRLLSALMAGVTALFCYLFVREALPGVRWAWTVGGLGVALLPLLGFMSGAVNPDAMLDAVCAALFYALARAFRRGLTLRLAVAIGLLGALGTLTKLNFLALLPGLILGLIVLGVRAARSSKAEGYRALAVALVLALAPVGLYVVINLFSNRAGLGAATSGINKTSGHGSLGGELSYIWQFYLPRLPGMATDFPGLSPIRQIWFDRSVGLYGWLDTEFPVWVENLALIPAALLAILGIRALVTLGATLRRRLLELAVYAVMGLGLLILIGGASYLEFPLEAEAYGQPRYLLPMLALIGAGLALSARGAGRCWGPAAGTLIVVLLLAHNIFSQLQVIARFYG
jgi:Predicted membrane protein (DUF2142)